MNDSATQLWNQFKKDNPLVANEPVEAWSFGNSPEMADELLTHVRKGEKTGTTSLYVLYELENEEIPQAGDYSIILDGEAHARAIIQTKMVDILPYSQITELHGYLEGEGDRTLKYWQSVHEPYFTKACEQVGIKFSKDMFVVYELFEVVCREND